MEEMPEIDAVIGTGEVDQIPAVVDVVLGGESFIEAGVPTFLYDHAAPRIQDDPSPHCCSSRFPKGAITRAHSASFRPCAAVMQPSDGVDRRRGQAPGRRGRPAKSS